MGRSLIKTRPAPARRPGPDRIFLDFDDDDTDDQPVIIKGEPLSETIIRERR